MILKKRTPTEVYYTNKLSKLWRESPMYWEATNRQKRAVNQYECEGCHKIFKLREIEVDHINPKVDPAVGWQDVMTFAARLNCPADQLQVLCEDNCHAKKTQNENKTRKR